MATKISLIHATSPTMLFWHIPLSADVLRPKNDTCTYRVWRSLFLLMLTIAAQTCLKHSRNHVQAFFSRAVLNE